MDDGLLTLPFLIALYPEIHYRFRFFPFSRYFRRQPEIIADLPHRLEPGSPLPVLLIIKDADRFPIQLEAASVSARHAEHTLTFPLNLPEQVIQQHWWHHLEWIELPDESPCWWEITVQCQIVCGKRRFSVQNDNLSGLSHQPLRVIQSGERLPREKGWFLGDLHAHTAYTEDHVEFGAPLSVYPAMGSAEGLSFALAADHSYDLDDLPSDFLRNDPKLQRYHDRSAELERLNQENRDRFVLIPGFELSVANSRGKNVHLLMLNQRDFLPGSGDSAERWLEVRSQYSLAEAMQRLNEEALAFAAHPFVKPPLLQRLLLNRDFWREQDLSGEGLMGLQIWNGETGRWLQKGLQRWTKGLLQGKRWKIIAGSDAHGNFNRYRQVGLPMLSLREFLPANGSNLRQVFGSVWTALESPDGLDVKHLLGGLQEHRSLISNGPFINLRLRRAEDGQLRACLEVQSSREFGSLSEIKLFWGFAGKPTERVLHSLKPKGQYTCLFNLPVLIEAGYLRAETITTTG
ncbi:MAG: hypothetical protein ABH878_04780, partial [bacterium]